MPICVFRVTGVHRISEITHDINPENENNLSFSFPIDTNILIEVNVCSYMEKNYSLSCGNQTLQAPSICMTVTDPEKNIEFYSFKNINSKLFLFCIFYHFILKEKRAFINYKKTNKLIYLVLF